MTAHFYFLYQRDGGEEQWRLETADKREEVIRELRPAFTTVLDLSNVPEDHDWTKVKYRGPLYFDFDADGDLDLACTQFNAFLAKLDSKLDFDLTQARLFASGGKGFHVEIPPECFQVKVPAGGTTWLPYIYGSMSESVIVDTMDTRVYTGKRGRMWRTAGVKRESGMYKVPITLGEALDITPELYLELISAPRTGITQTPPTYNPKLGMSFNASRDKVANHMRGRKKRVEKSNAYLDPWRKSGKTPPTIERLMSGEIVADGIGFNRVAMQLAIYATSVGWDLDTFLDKCKGLCETYTGDSARYGTERKRREQLADQFRYMDDNSMYEFDTAPIVKLVKRGVPTNDLGTMETEDSEDEPTKPAVSEDDEENGEASVATSRTNDALKGLRKGFFANSDGMWRRTGDVFEPICRASLRKVISFLDADSKLFKGYEFEVVVDGRKPHRAMLGADAFVSVAKIKSFFANYQISFQGTDQDAIGLLDVMAEKAIKGGGRTFVYPREGLFLIDHPLKETPEPVKIYLTQNSFLSSLTEGEKDYFTMSYRPTMATSTYNIDIHRSPELNESHIPALHDLFMFSKDEVLADLIGWMVACHYRSFYLKLFNQFPLLQVYGEAGSGKSQTIWVLAHMHWFMTPVSIKSAMSCTPFAMDSHASTSTSAPFILDEYKPRAMQKGKVDKAKDVFKASYIGGDIGERGTINRGAESGLSVIRSQATSPIVFLGEAIEMETAIIERSVSVGLSKTFQTRSRKRAFDRLHTDPSAISALGRLIVEMGFSINLDQMRAEFTAVRDEIESKMPDYDDLEYKRPAPRMIFNKAIIVHALGTLKAVLSNRLGNEFDEVLDNMIKSKMTDTRAQEDTQVLQALGMSEMTRVLSRMAIMSRDDDAPWQLRVNKDYVVGDQWIEMRVERAYDHYRRFCATVQDIPLFDNLTAFTFGLNSYVAVIDRQCADSVLREEGSNEKIVRFDLRTLNREGVNSFRN